MEHHFVDGETVYVRGIVSVNNDGTISVDFGDDMMDGELNWGGYVCVFPPAFHKVYRSSEVMVNREEQAE